MSGVKFGNHHTETEWGLHWVDTEIPEAQAKTYSIEVPGRDGVIDLTEVLTPDVKFQNRLLAFTFILVDRSQSTWHNVYSKISNAINGRKLEVILDTDRAHYWLGRCTVSSTKEDGAYSSIIVSVDADPYKYDVASYQEGQWLWDPFRFVDGVIPQKIVEIVGEALITVNNNRKLVSPSITCSQAMTVVFQGQEYALKAGINTHTGIWLTEGDNVLLFRGYGTVKIQYERGSL